MLNGGEAEEAPLARVYGGPLPLDQLLALRTDFKDVAVPSLGGTELRVYALSGTARAKLVPEMAHLAASRNPDGSTPEGEEGSVIEGVMHFQTRVVAASLGYPEDQWNAVGSSLGYEAVEALYAVAAVLSGLDKREQDKATVRLRPKRSVASGTDSPSS